MTLGSGHEVFGEKGGSSVDSQAIRGPVDPFTREIVTLLQETQVVRADVVVGYEGALIYMGILDEKTGHNGREAGFEDAAEADRAEAGREADRVIDTFRRGVLGGVKPVPGGQVSASFTVFGPEQGGAGFLRAVRDRVCRHTDVLGATTPESDQRRDGYVAVLNKGRLEYIKESESPSLGEKLAQANPVAFYDTDGGLVAVMRSARGHYGNTLAEIYVVDSMGEPQNAIYVYHQQDRTPDLMRQQ